MVAGRFSGALCDKLPVSESGPVSEMRAQRDTLSEYDASYEDGHIQGTVN
jgi:hypothetical protein